MRYKKGTVFHVPSRQHVGWGLGSHNAPYVLTVPSQIRHGGAGGGGSMARDSTHLVDPRDAPRWKVGMRRDCHCWCLMCHSLVQLRAREHH